MIFYKKKKSFLIITSKNKKRKTKKNIYRNFKMMKFKKVHLKTLQNNIIYVRNVSDHTTYLDCLNEYLTSTKNLYSKEGRVNRRINLWLYRTFSNRSQNYKYLKKYPTLSLYFLGKWSEATKLQIMDWQT
jgi:7-cyano-7-deazaguanine synthase in queuosine biosynthesis